MKLKELLDNCTIGQGLTKNGREYVYGNVSILDRNIKTKNIWVESIIYDYIDLTEEEIRSEITKYFSPNVRQVCILDSVDTGNTRVNLIDELQNIINEYELTSGKKVDINTLTGIISKSVIPSLKI